MIALPVPRYVTLPDNLGGAECEVLRSFYRDYEGEVCLHLKLNAKINERSVYAIECGHDLLIVIFKE